MSAYRSLMVPLDGSKLAEQAVPFALDIARRAGARVELVHVVSHPWLPVLLSAQSAAHLLAHWQSYLQSIADRAQRESGVVVGTRVMEGAEVAAFLAVHAQDAGVDLVVMNTHGRGALNRFWFGSVAYECLRYLPMPILFVKHDGPLPDLRPIPAMKRMLVLLDGSALAEHVIEPAVTFSALLGLDLCLLRVIDEIPHGTPELDSIGLSSPAMELIDEIWAVRRRVQKEAKEYLERIAEKLRARGFRVTTQVHLAADPGTAIVEAGEAAENDLTALETRGNRGLSDRVLGSVARKLLYGTSKPVFVESAWAAIRRNPS